MSRSAFRSDSKGERQRHISPKSGSKSRNRNFAIRFASESEAVGEENISASPGANRERGRHRLEHHARHPAARRRGLRRGFRATVAPADAAVSLNRCDQPVEIAGGGTEPQYRAGLEVALDQPPAAALEEIFKGLLRGEEAWSFRK
ncbi:hypothetical protein [Paracoccus mutanolyticus]|uniref:hypothetical protein n=1 Tax=Paracoccus mutanolyticus TaxID=1499308 RepID=UPI0011AE6B9B|nr:hypothetical protein [Paracoccus mutanolyticus]